MNLNLPLERDLCFFDIESTGLNVLRDRILQLAIIKFPKGNGEPLELSMLINPSIPISEEAMSIHGITPKDVARKPTFEQVAKQIFDFIGDSDLAGYNSSRFDIPMLMEEFDRAGMEFDLSKRRIIDVQRIFYKMEPRTLKAALKYYCNEDIEDAHDALADVKATISVFKGQIERYKDTDFIDDDGNRVESPIKPDIKALHDFTNDLRFADATQKMKYDHNNVLVFSFGKYQNQPVAEVFKKDRNYYNWIQTKEFSAQVKQITKAVMKELEKQDKK